MSSLDSTPQWAAPVPLTQAVRTRHVRNSRGRQRFRRRIRNRILFAVFVLLVALGAGAVYLYLGPAKQALAKMKDAEQQVTLVQNQVKAGVGTLDASKLRVMQAAVDRARADVHDVQAIADQYGPLLDAARVLPYAGPRVANAQNLLRVATHALDSLTQLARVVLAVAPDKHATSAHTSSARVLLVTLSHYRPTLRSALAEWSQAVAFARPVPRATQLGNSADHFLEVFDQRTDQVTQLVSAMLDLQAVTSQGATYLLVSQNPDEQRATGGFIGFSALLHVDLSGLRVGKFLVSKDVDGQYTSIDPNRPAPAGTVPAPLPAAYYANWEAWFFRDGNWSPDFRVSARQLERFYQRGQAVLPDGVIAVEPQLLARMLTVTGPVTVPGTGVTLNASNALAVLHYTEYVLVDKQFTLQAWQAIMARVLTIHSSEMFRVVEVLAKALRHQELQVYANDTGLETVLGQTRLDGGVTHGSDDYLYVVDTNLGYTKVDPFIRRNVVDSVVPLADGSVVHNLAITYTNTLRANMVLTKDQGGTNTTYLDYLRVLAPAGSVELTSDGWEQWAPSITDGREVLSGAVSIGAGYSNTVRLRYKVPAAVARGGAYAIHVDSQPGGYAATVQICLAGKTGPTCHAASNQAFDWSVKAAS